ncbi:MAG: hypothetical protein WDZ80_07665, partial [Candidatus Paceibacterota bacterium]
NFYNPSNGAFELQPSSRRMPGILPLYAPLYSLFEQVVARDLMIIIQLLLSIIAVALLYEIAHLITKNELTAQLAFWVYLISPFTGIYDHFGLAESLTTSFSIFGVFFYLKSKHLINHKRGQVFYILSSGIFLIWAITLRSAVALLLALVLCDLVFTYLKFNKNLSLLRVPLILIPTFLVLSIWVGRNYVVKNEFTPLGDSVFKSMPHIYTQAEKSLRPLINHWGGQRKKFYPNSMGAFFYDNTQSTSMFPDYIFNNSFTKDSLIQLKSYFLKAHKEMTNENIFRNKAKKVQQQFRKDHPVKYHFIAPIKSLFRLYFISSDYRLPFPSFSEMSLLQKLIKISNILLFNAIAVFALMGLVLSLTKVNPNISLILYPFMYSIILGCILYNTEVRYQAIVFPFLVIPASIAFTKLIEIVSKKANLES